MVGLDAKKKVTSYKWQVTGSWFDETRAKIIFVNSICSIKINN